MKCGEQRPPSPANIKLVYLELCPNPTLHNLKYSQSSNGLARFKILSRRISERSGR